MSEGHVAVAARVLTGLGKKGAGKDQTVAPEVADEDETLDVPERAEDRKAARRKHRTRFREQVVSWGFKLALAAACYPLFRWEIGCLSTCFRQAQEDFGCYAVLTLFLLVGYGLPLSLIIGAAWNNYVHHDIKNDWKTAKARAKQFADPEEVARGWTEVFDMYVRTKRRGYHLLAWAIIAFLYAFAGGVAMLVGSHSEALLWWLYLPSLILDVGAGFALLRIAYIFGTWYLPGDLIVTHTLALIIHAVTNINDPNMARRAASQSADRFVHRNPWWFYMN